MLVEGTAEAIRLSNISTNEMLGHRLGELVELMQAQAIELASVRQEIAFLREVSAKGQDIDPWAIGDLGPPLDMDDSPQWGDEPGASQDVSALDHYQDTRKHLLEYGTICGDRALGDDHGLEQVDTEGDELNINWRATEVGDLEPDYNQGLKQIKRPRGSRWWIKVCKWLLVEAQRRGDVRRIKTYEENLQPYELGGMH